MLKTLRGKTVLVTGASEGVGKACAERLVEEGANVVMIARREAVLQTVADGIGKPDQVLTIARDLTDLDALPDLIEAATRHFGRLHGLVNNAGFNARGALDSIAPSEVSRIIALNLTVPVLLTQCALPRLKAHAEGSIVNVASLAGMVAMPHEATYSASKHGLRGFSFSLAEELVGTGVSCSVVSPGPIDTGFIRHDLDTVPDYVFSQPVSSALDVAECVLDCLKSGARERAIPKQSARLAKVGALLPGLARSLRPALSRKGAKVKRRYQS